MKETTQTRRPADSRGPEIKREEILLLRDDNFSHNNVCLVTGAATGIGRATAIAAAVNNLMTVGLDINAGIQHIDSVDNFPMEKYDFMQRLMLSAPFYHSKLVIPYMKKAMTESV